MTAPSLQVISVNLRALARRCETLAGRLGVSPAPVTASAWQSSGAATTAANAGATRAAMSLKARMTSTGSKVSNAAHNYTAMDDQGAAALAGVGYSLSAGSGTDGGAGGLGATPPGPPTGYPGADGGAGGFEIPR